MPEPLRTCLSLCILLLGMALPLAAQDAEETPPPAEDLFASHTWEIYLNRTAGAGGQDQVLFVDVLTGEMTQVDVTGERYSVVSNAVWYFDYQTLRMMLLEPGQPPREHPFIQLEESARRVDWLISPDGRSVAWTLTLGEPERLSTITYLSKLDGTMRREIFRDGPREGIRALPVAFSQDASLLYMDAHPDGLGRFVAYTQYAGLFQVDIETGAVSTLPGEPACFCGAGIFDSTYLRLALTSDLSGFDVRYYDLVAGFDLSIPAIRLPNFTQAGEVLIAPGGNQAVYALSQIQNFGTPNQSVRTVFILVDLLAQTQRALTEPITTYVYPVRWTEDNSAILFASPQRTGTWKINLEDGALVKVAEASYLGSVRD